MITLNALSQMAALGAVLVVQTLYMIVVARVLGPEDFGRFSFAWSIIQILLIGGDLGLHNTALRKISFARRHSSEISRVFLTLKLGVALILYLCVLGVAALAHVSAETKLSLIVFGLGMMFHCFSIGLNVVFQAHGMLYFGSLNVLILFSLQAVFGLSFLYSGGGVVSLAMAYVLACFLSTVPNLVLLSKYVHRISFGLRGARAFALESIPVGMATFFQTVSGRIAVALLTLLSGPFQAGIYSAAVRIPQAMSNVPIGIFSAVLPALAAESIASAGYRRLFRRSLLLMLLISVPLAGVLFVYANPLVLLIFGSEYVDSGLSLQILALTVVPVFTGMAFSHVLLSQRQLVKRLPWITGIALLSNLVANWILIPRMESLGAAISLLITETVLAVGYLLAAKSFLRKAVDPVVTRSDRSRDSSRLRVAFVIHRYGKEVVGGAERLALELAEHLLPRFDVEVLTSCASDYKTWENDHRQGLDSLNGVPVRRFRTVRKRHWWLFGKLSGFLFALKRLLLLPEWLERWWVVQQGPYVPDLIEYLEDNRYEYDVFVFFSYLYYPCVKGLPVVRDRAVLVPTAHREPAIFFSTYRHLFEQPAFQIFMTQTERELVHGLFGNEHIPFRVAGMGMEPIQRRTAVHSGFLLYAGRIEVGKGCPELFEFCRRLDVDLTAIGPSQIQIPTHVNYKGVVDGIQKADLFSSCLAVVVPSVLESLSIVTLEAWAFGKPVVARKGSAAAALVERSGGGYCYSNFQEFREVISKLDPTRGEKGRAFLREHFSWDKVLEKYIEAIETMAASVTDQKPDTGDGVKNGR